MNIQPARSFQRLFSDLACALLHPRNDEVRERTRSIIIQRIGGTALFDSTEKREIDLTDGSRDGSRRVPPRALNHSRDFLCLSM